MAAAARSIYSHATKQAGVRGGRACIDDTRIAVVDTIAILEQGKPPEEILLAYPSLNLAQVYAAISYYHANKDEIEAELAEDDGWGEDHERRRKEHLRAAR